MPKPRFLLGLPALKEGPLWDTARALEAPVLISANALSRWRIDEGGYRTWCGFDPRHLHLVANHPVALDSAGFVAAQHYRGFPWDTDDYLDLAAAAPWLWWASQDWCVEPEIAHDRDAVFDRISGTVRLNTLCLIGAERRRIRHSFVPVIQGWEPLDYVRCIERMPFVRDFPLIGVGSMCRRHVEGPNGILAVLETLRGAFAGMETRFHLFGLKSIGMQHTALDGRVASCDSQAYGVAARQNALRMRVSKSDRMLAGVMRDWYTRQIEIANAPPMPRRLKKPSTPPVENPMSPIETRILDAYDELRALHEDGELGWSSLTPEAAYQFAFLDD